ncbi:hypothetical protein PpBr36_00362, partial [Pyricularia pennisetigena]|uniref:hypothetical protein n=1 Tax=Pyricularia pennisetigena TaxID=1578925 RepID=UPI001152AC00
FNAVPRTELKVALGHPYLKILLIRVTRRLGEVAYLGHRPNVTYATTLPTFLPFEVKRRPPSTTRLGARCQISNSCYLSKDAPSPSSSDAACVGR